jgi:hypothetical protein
MARQLSRGHSLKNPNTTASKAKKLAKDSKVPIAPVKILAKKAVKKNAPAKATKVSKKKPIKKVSNSNKPIKKVVTTAVKGVKKVAAPKNSHPASIKGYSGDQYAKFLS